MTLLAAGLLMAHGRAQSKLIAGTYNFSTFSFDSTATNGVRLATDRDVDENENGAYTDSGDWLVSSGTPSDYEVSCTVNSGSLSSGTTGSYEALSAAREWTVQQASLGVATANITLTIRRIANPSDSVQLTVVLSATYDTIGIGGGS